MARKTIQAAGLQQGHKIVAVGSESHENRRLVVTSIQRGGAHGGRSITVRGTSRGGAEKTLFERLAPNKPITISITD